jgi:hypothetical protein
MCLGGVGAQIGWLLFALGSIFFWSFAWHADYSGWRFQPGKVARVQGEVLNCRETGYSIDDETVYAYEYHYQVNGASIGGVSYYAGGCTTGPVTVEYLNSNPEISRIEGTRRGVVGPLGSLVAVVPAFALGLIVFGWRKGMRRIKLLRVGVPATGRVVEKHATNSETMGRTNYRVVVAFTGRDGREGHTTIVTNHPEALEEGTGSLVLHDPANPRHALPLAEMPGNVSEDGTGSFVGGPPAKYLVLPLLSLLLNAWLISKI